VSLVKNSSAGTRVWVNLSGGCAKYMSMLLDDLISAIQANCPAGEWNDSDLKIRLQQDNAGGCSNVHDPWLMDVLAMQQGPSAASNK
jgi:hypothetical protein